jgi:radical SAM protein with 4Fe4S-binding SPASM domain
MFKKIESEFDNIVENKFLSRRSSLELVINEKCQNACKYCYRKYKHDNSNIFSLDAEIVKKHIYNLLDLFRQDSKEFFKNRSVELYGGDPLLNYKHSLDVIKIVDSFKPKTVTVPTNARLVSELSDYDIGVLLNSTETRISLSLSVDGLPNEHNRPLSKIGKMLVHDETINYEKLFKIARKYGCGFHPMLPFDSIDNWLSVVKFFLEKFGVVPYLLEIRHSLSDDDIMKAVVQLAKIRDYYESIDEKAVGMANTIRASVVPRGLGCSALTTITIMPNGDMPFCHRVIDPPWVYGNVNYGVDISKMISLTSVFDHRNVPSCFACPIRMECSGQCAGACYEYWGNPWMPIPSVCNYMRLKTYIFSLRYDDWKRTHKNKMDELKAVIEENMGSDVINKVLEKL